MKRVPFLLLIVLCVFIAGCGPSAGGSYTVTGRITKADDPGQGLEGVTIAFSGGYGTATTDASGNWSKSGLADTVIVTPAKEGWTFTPASRQVTKAASNVDFAASAASSTYMISGRVTREDNGEGLELVVIRFSGGFTGVATQPNGTWCKVGLRGAVTVTPSRDGWGFDPPSRQVTGAADDVNFIAGAYTVSGRVTHQDSGQGLGGVTMRFNGGPDTVITEEDGTWRKGGLNGSVTVTPMKEGLAFYPRNKVVVAAASDIDFTGLEAFPITFEDPNLEAVVRAAINQPAGQLMNTDVKNLAHLDAYWRHISRLGGIQYLISLETLRLGSNQVSDISPLAGLTNMEALYLGENQISDISPLAGLTNIRSLELEKNQISDLSALTGLTKMEVLGLYFNQVSNISPLAGLTSMVYLDLDSNQVSNISALTGLTNIKRLDLSMNQISDISPLAGLTALNMLDLSPNQISDISALVDNTGLGDGDIIWLKYNRLDLSPGSQAMKDINALEARGVTVHYEPQR